MIDLLVRITWIWQHNIMYRYFLCQIIMKNHKILSYKNSFNIGCFSWTARWITVLPDGDAVCIELLPQWLNYLNDPRSGRFEILMENFKTDKKINLLLGLIEIIRLETHVSPIFTHWNTTSWRHYDNIYCFKLAIWQFLELLRPPYSCSA